MLSGMMVFGQRLLGGSLIRPTSTLREDLVTWFGAAGSDCREVRQFLRHVRPGTVLGRRRRREIESLDGESGLRMRLLSALVQV